MGTDDASNGTFRADAAASAPRVALGVSGGIAAYKAAEVLRGLQRAGCEVRVAMTEHATKLVAPLTFRALSGAHVVVDDYAPDNPDPIAHITFAQTVDLLVVAPATADVIAKFANGVADDFLSTTYLACHAPVLVAPAMNTTMWEHPATRRNIERLRADGVHIVEPDAGEMACGTIGPGRLSAPERIVAAALDIINKRSTGPNDSRARTNDDNCAPENDDSARAANDDDRARSNDDGARSNDDEARATTGDDPALSVADPALSVEADLAGERVLITAGATREEIDPVRFISNRSSGRMGFAVAEAARARGAEVTVVAGVTTAARPAGVRYLDALSAEEMHAAVAAEVARATIFVAAAAVADYRPSRRAAQKIKKSDAPLTIELEPTPDILASVAASRHGDLIVVGFAAESERVVEHARAKLRRKQLDAVVANDITRDGAGFDAATNAVTIITRDREEPLELPLMPKLTAAHRILDEIARLRRERIAQTAAAQSS